VIGLGTPGILPTTVENDLDAVTVTVTTRCPVGHAVAAGLLQLFAVGLVGEKTPVSVAHWQDRDADAVTPVVLIESTAVVSIIVILALCASE
jgi:hypothetical protein